MPPAWQSELAASFTDPFELLDFLGLDPDGFPGLGEAAKGFPFRVTRSFAERMARGDPADPLLRQVLPVPAELEERPGFVADAVGDLGAGAAPGLLHKYRGRVLVIATGACAIHCRYCFRREFPYGDRLLSRQREREALEYIAADESIHEVILSGGDPLVLPDDRLAALVAALAEIPHLRRLRIHSRLPVVLPSRLTPTLAETLGSGRLRAVLVIHANHPAELNEEVDAGLSLWRKAGVSLLNQAVLLKGVNDRADILIQLSETLFDHGVLPYYLHLLDRARGTAHFEVQEPLALELMETMRERLPGYLMPRLVREVAGEAYKRPVS
jgi:EF-P beta-lysylation protein EpmB